MWHLCSALMPAQMVESGLTAREAYDAVPELHVRGERALQNLRKRARKERARNEPAAPTKPVAKPAAKPPTPVKKKPLSRLEQLRLMRQGKTEAQE